MYNSRAAAVSFFADALGLPSPPSRDPALAHVHTSLRAPIPPDRITISAKEDEEKRSQEGETE